MKKIKNLFKKRYQNQSFFLTLLIALSFSNYAQCNTNLWRGRSQSTITGCVSNWVAAGQYIHNGVLQMPANQTCDPTYYYPESLMTDSLCITPDFTFEVRLRNLNPTPPLNLSAYDVYLKILNTSA
jgi:hypothetical protein